MAPSDSKRAEVQWQETLINLVATQQGNRLLSYLVRLKMAMSPTPRSAFPEQRLLTRMYQYLITGTNRLS